MFCFLITKIKPQNFLQTPFPWVQEGDCAVFVLAFPLLRQLLEFFVMLLAKNHNGSFDMLPLKSS